jgi:hypothetical protein
MHARLTQSPPNGAGLPIRGTFYPAADRGGSHGPLLPRLIAVLVAMAAVRGMIRAAGRHHGGTGRGRRHEAIARLHRELHDREAGAEGVQA